MSPAAHRARPLGTMCPARTGRKRTATAGANLQRGAGGTAAEEGRKGGREGAASFPRPHQEHPWSRKQAGGSPARMQRGARSEALRGQAGRSTEERAESERLNSLNDLIRQSCLNRNRAGLQNEHRHVAWRGWFGPWSWRDGEGKKKWHGNAGCDGQRTGTAAEKDTEAQLNAINKTFIQTITQYRAHFSLWLLKKVSALYSLHTSVTRVVFVFFFFPPQHSVTRHEISWVKNL